MQLEFVRRTGAIFAVAGIAALVITTFMQSRPVLASPPPPPAMLNPIRLASVHLPDYVVPVSPAPAISGNVTITLTSSGGPFCLQGLRISPSTSSLDPAGAVWISLDRIDGHGLSYPHLTLLDDTTQGTLPQDVVLSYGNAICATSSIEFQARQFSVPSGPGQPVGLHGTAIYLSASNVIVTAS